MLSLEAAASLVTVNWLAAGAAQTHLAYPVVCDISQKRVLSDETMMD